MLFNSFAFVALVVLTLLLYYRQALAYYQVPMLILASAVFYSYTQPVLLVLLLFSAGINTVCSYHVAKPDAQSRRAVAVLGVIFNLLVLAFFKYSALLTDLGVLELAVAIPLPIGISFYTFQGISLVVDVFKHKQTQAAVKQKSFSQHCKNSLLFIMFFPQLIAGPIVKAQDFYPQIRQKFFRDVDLYYAYKTLVMGYFLKSVIADNLKDQTFWIAAPYFSYQSSFTLVVMLVGYSFQIFADFAGYSLIAIGIASLFGYRLPQNFNFPYISRSITEFWQRWHISLSSWLKEYLYIGLLGGNRKTPLRTYFNLIIVMFLGGLWHGAAMSYGVWGLWHGIGLALERLSSQWLAARNPAISKAGLSTWFTGSLRMCLVFVFVSYGWLFFKLNDFNDVVNYTSAMASNTGFSHNTVVILNIAIYSLPIALYHAAYLAKAHTPRVWEKTRSLEPLLYAGMLFLIVTNGGIPGEFVYFQF